MADIQTEEIARKRVYLFFSIFVLALIGVLAEEADQPAHLIDDFGVIAIGVIAIAYIVINHRKKDLAIQNNTLAILYAVAFLFKVVGIVLELNDPADLGDDIPLLVLTALAVINRFT